MPLASLRCRLDELVMFQPLGRPQLREIVRHLISDVGKRLEERNIDVVCTEAAYDRILQDAYDPAFGARPMR